MGQHRIWLKCFAVMPPIIRTFVGRRQELDQWSELLADAVDVGDQALGQAAGQATVAAQAVPAEQATVVGQAVGQAVVVVGKYGMGKTWLLDQMVRKAQASPSLQCFAVRYVMGPGESPGMILRTILEDMFQAARYEAGSLDSTGKRFEQWTRIYRELKLFCTRTESDFRFLEQLRFDNRKNIFEQFTSRLQLLSQLMPDRCRLLFIVDPELDTFATRVELWTHVVNSLPPKVIFLFAQRYKDSLAINDEFRSLSNVHFIPSLELQPQGLADLEEEEAEQLFDAFLPIYKDKSIDRQAVLARFRQYHYHPYAVHAALHLLLLPHDTLPDPFPAEQMPNAVCPSQWKGIAEHPLHEEAARLFKAYAVLEIPTLDEMACWVAGISLAKLEKILDDPFLSSMIRSEASGRSLYHHYLMEYIRSLLCDEEGGLTQEARQLHQKAITGYKDLTSRTIKPEPLATIRLAEHSLVVGGPTLFAQTLRQCSEVFLSLGFYQTHAALFDRALALVSPLSEEAADLHLQMGELRHRQGDYPAALKHYEVSLQIARKILGTDRIAPALFGLGRISLAMGHLIEADMWLRDAIAYYEVSANKLGLAEASVLAAEVYWLQGHTHEAEKTLDTAFQATGAIRNYRQQAKMMSAIHAAWGRMYDQMGNTERSAEQYHKALDFTKNIYDRAAEAEIRLSLSSIFERIGNLKAAAEHLTNAMSIYYDLKSLEEWAETNLRLARIAEVQGKPKTKDFHIEQARQMYQQLGNNHKLRELEGK